MYEVEPDENWVPGDPIYPRDDLVWRCARCKCTWDTDTRSCPECGNKYLTKVPRSESFG